MIACDCSKVYTLSDFLYHVVASGLGSWICLEVLNHLGWFDEPKVVEKPKIEIEDNFVNDEIVDVVDYLIEFYKLTPDVAADYQRRLESWHREGKLELCDYDANFAEYCKKVYEQLTLGYEKI